MALRQLGITSRNLLPVGEGVWAERLRSEMAQRGVSSDLQVSGEDNGWCLALVEPDGERTFISIDGIENQWQPEWLADVTPQSGLVYLSGYQLGARQNTCWWIGCYVYPNRFGWCWTLARAST